MSGGQLASRAVMVNKEGLASMMFQRFGERLLVRLESGEPVVESITALLEEEGIGFAVLNGLGAARYVRLAYLDVEQKRYEAHEVEEQLEVVSLIGNAALRDGKPFLHVHVSMGRRDLSLFGGHLQELIANPTIEVWVQPEAEPALRVFDD
ncbi:MAG TPA: PPC domain-containing DNA-binding protein, partial [Candidatus Limnocylindria bacterium]|nr:PPC domain-containing DNA-binding protein [Candidatus Limnocylindria bacterium]